ncbi:hypothetical protein JRC04_02935 [Mycolicibacterium sp. S2-37]|uniref:hypothetical protein n=1 Tax=Mycolicibacterium sp. S2-37 TaxID=2810297 RepID=UPI001A94EB29|nr:hypothetical protein [Mycolicibacterium sp. S2-37]MBO0676414.1 hypothetical protein [Mycolicibacterium sp. S2-37]
MAHARSDHLVPYLDQAMFLGLRATGQAAVMQCVWIYEHPVDYDGLRRFHRNFGYGLAGRHIEPSPLPFGRHRWVSALGPQSDIDIAENVLPRAALGDWLDARAQVPVDPEWGPGWHLAVQPLDDGATAVTLVGSHCLSDGGGALLTVFNAVTGNTADLGYAPPKTRTRRQAVLEDARQLARDMPELGRTVAAAARLAYRRRKQFARPVKRDRQAGDGVPDEAIVTPAISVFVDGGKWDARAEALGGNSYSLLAGFAARLSQRIGRHRPEDGAVAFTIPINDRTLEDTRANAVKLATAHIDPRRVTEDLTEARAAIKQALKTVREVPDETLALLPLVPFIPKRAVQAMADVAFGFSDLRVSCSNLGDLPVEIGRVDGTDAEFVTMRGVDGHISRRVLEERSGILTVVGARIGDTVSIAVIGYQPGAVNTKPWLADLVMDTLAEFDLPAVAI